MEDRPISPALKIAAVLMFVFLLAPVLLVVPISFSADNYMSFPPSGWSFKWYAAFFSNGRMLEALGTSTLLALIVTALSLLIALPASYALVRSRILGADTLLAIFTAPLLLPTIVLGLAILIVFAGNGLLGTFAGLTIAHLVIVLPYALRVLTTSLSGLRIVTEEAASTLGASPLMVVRRVTLPLMMPGIVATAALAFLVSFDEAVISLFLTGPRITTLPVAMYQHVDAHADPLVASISVLLIVLTLAVVIVVDRSVGLTKAFVK
ncbi:polyamine ABC transporter permease [Aureimonas endophytica]|uniref:Polyamine ABC transporter permease n=1 Tax=Aureimonas endophytica TaxID=2027858 RepID=A0A917A0K5_9HYPH|nr:ABC transporter permease [Aureimonas endophytica]GGE21350.1 polyamine ABC transporter permease [Aureimonas endophytica]